MYKGLEQDKTTLKKTGVHTCIHLNVCERETENVGHRKDCNFFPYPTNRNILNLTKYLPTKCSKSRETIVLREKSSQDCQNYFEKSTKKRNVYMKKSLVR